MNEASRARPDASEFDLQAAREEYNAYVQRAREHHARTGEWPPDPLLDEVAEMRRQIMAEHDNDWRKVMRWHIEQDRLFMQQNPNARFLQKPRRPGRPAGDAEVAARRRSGFDGG